MFSNAGPWVRALHAGRRGDEHVPHHLPGRPAVAGAVHGVRSRSRDHRPRRLPRRLRGVERHVVLGSAHGWAAGAPAPGRSRCRATTVATAISRGVGMPCEVAHGDPAMMSPVLTAEELHRRAVEAVNRGRVRLAGRLLERAAERSTDPDFLGPARGQPARTSPCELGDLETATQLCRESLARPGLRPTDRGVALAQLAMLPDARGRRRPTRWRRSPRGSRLLAELPAELARALGNRGDVYLHAGPAARGRRRLPRGSGGLRHRRARRRSGQGRAQPRLRADAGG